MGWSTYTYHERGMGWEGAHPEDRGPYVRGGAACRRRLLRCFSARFRHACLPGPEERSKGAAGL